MVSRFPPSAYVPACRTLVARGNATTKRIGFPPRPAAFPTIGRGRSPGLWDRAYRLPVGLRPQWLSRYARTHLPLRGQQRHWQESLPHLFPVSPRREVRAGTPRTSALIVQHKSAGLSPAAASGIYIENESLHLDLTGFSKL